MNAIRSNPGRRRRNLVATVLATALAAVLAACGTAAPPAGAADGGTLRWGWYLPTSWDPITSTAGTDVHVLSLAYSALTQTDPEGKAVPGLASAWKYDDTGTQVTFTLRPGLTFSDGTALDATAVEKSLERSRTDPKSLVAPQLVTVKDIVAVDPTTVRVDLTTPNYQIPNLFAGKTGMIVSPTAFTADAAGLATKPVGAGPFTLTSYVPNSKAELAKFDGFWNAGEIHLAKVEVVPAPDPATAAAQVNSGQLDVASVPGSQVEAAKAAGLEVAVNDSLAVWVIDVNNTVAPFDNPKVVEAIKYAVDRKALLATQAFGQGAVDYQPFPPGYVGFDDSIGDLYPHDVAKAKQLLAEAGYPNGLDLTLSSYAAQGQAEQVQAQLAEAGIRVKINVVPISQASQRVYVQRTEPFFIDQFAGRDSVAQAFQVLFGAEGLMNIGKTHPAELDAAVQKIVQTPLDDPSYPAVVQAATKIAVTTMPNVFLYTAPKIWAYKPTVTGLQGYLAVQRFEGVRVG